MSEWMDVKEVAKYLKVKEWTIYEWLRNGRVPASRMVGQWRFQKDVIDNWLFRGSETYKTKPRLLSKRQSIKTATDTESIQQKQKQIIQREPSSLPSINSNENISFLERRKEERIFIKKGEMFIKIVVNFPKRQEFVGQVVDMSTSGVSFILKGEKEAVISGTPLKKIVVGNDRYSKTINNSNVRYCISAGEDEPDNLRVGLQFDIKPFEHSVIRRRLLGAYKIRMQRYGGGLFTSLRWKIACTYKRKQIVSGQLVNFSKFGLAFKIDEENAPSFQEGALLEKFSLNLEDKLVYTGKATVVNLAEDAEHIIVRCSLEGSIDLEDVFSLVRSKKGSEEICNFIASVDKSKEIETPFKAEIADLRVFLEKTKQKLDAEEANVNAKDVAANVEYYKKVILDKVSSWVFMRLKHHFYNIWKIVKNFDEERYNLHKRYFQDQLLHLFLVSPFIKRSFDKPLGYAGDYKMIDMIYSEPFEGSSIFAKALNSYPIQERTSQAVRNRLGYLLNKFSDLLKKRNNQVLRIMDVGCGPAREIQEMLKSNLLIDRFEFTLLDADKEAISYSQEKVTGLLKRKANKIKINFVNKDVVQLAQEKDLIDKFGKYDLIYSLGLFDYLTLNLSKRLTKCLYEFLKPNSKLIIGNFNVNTNENKTYMDFVLEWSLFYRPEAEMIKFIENLEKPKKVYFETEDTGLTNFLVIEK